MNDERFMQLVSNWLDGSLTEAESTELQAVLEGSVERRNDFVDLCGLDADLRLMSASLSDDLILVDANAVSPAERARVSVGWFGLVAVIAATLLLAIGYGVGRDRNEQTPTEVAKSEKSSNEPEENVETGCAVLSRLVDARFPDGVVHQEGDSLPPGRLKLLSGAVQIDFFSGATMLIDESAEVKIISSWEAECFHGKVTMHVPPPAVGFRLLLPGMKVVDLGTEFGVEVKGSESSVHVFDGEVEAHVRGSQMQIVRQGESLETSADRGPVAGAAKPAEFPNVEQFEERIEAFYNQRINNWRDSMKSVRTDERVIGCYLFRRWEDKRWDRLVNNFTIPRHPSRAGSAVGTRWVEGRWPMKDAMEFKNPGDRVRINLGDAAYDGLTMAAWIRVDGLDRKYNALLLTDGYEDGEPHWQIDQAGRLMFSVSYWRSPSQDGPQFKAFRQNQIYYSPPVFGSGGRRWHHVAVTFDSTTGEAVQYFDGKEVSREVSEHHRAGRKVTFGACEIGNWGLPLEGVPFPVRNLNGRVDEFLIYQEPLSGDEITSLYKLGIPN